MRKTPFFYGLLMLSSLLFAAEPMGYAQRSVVAPVKVDPPVRAAVYPRTVQMLTDPAPSALDPQ